MNRKITIKELSGLCTILTNQELAEVIGGGVGTKANPYTLDEVSNMSDLELLNSFYYEDDNGQIHYYYGGSSVTVYGNYGACSYTPYSYGIYSSEYAVGGYHVFTYSEYEAMLSAGEWSGGYVRDGDIQMYIPQEGSDGNNDLLDFTSHIGDFWDGVEKGAGKTQVGTNGILYFETKTGRVFMGNQYVGTTSLQGLAKSINVWLGPINLGISVYNVVNATQNEGVNGALKQASHEAGTYTGAWAGAKMGAFIGSSFGPCGTLVGGVVGAVGGAIGGGIAGDYIVRICY